MVTLRKLSQQDLEMVMHWRMLPEITKYMYSDPSLTIDDQIRWYHSIKQSERERYWIIEIENKTPVGLISLNNIDFKNKQCSWAYYIAEEKAKGKGLGKTLECNIYDYVFYSLNLNKLWCEVFKFNDKVVKLHKLFGSEIEGEFRDHIFKNGQFYDVVRMAITKRKWEEIRLNYRYSKINIE